VSNQLDRQTANYVELERTTCEDTLQCPPFGAIELLGQSLDSVLAQVICVQQPKCRDEGICGHGYVVESNDAYRAGGGDTVTAAAEPRRGAMTREMDFAEVVVWFGMVHWPAESRVAQPERRSAPRLVQGGDLQNGYRPRTSKNPLLVATSF
jgi:hypothetical protein